MGPIHEYGGGWDEDGWYDDDPICPYCGADESEVCEAWCETQRPATEPAPTDDNRTTTPSNDPLS